MKRTFLFALLFVATTSIYSQQVLRTGAIADRGLTAADFPQTKKLMENIYVFSDLHTLGYMTNDLVVITSDGVLVADGQGSVPVTQKLVEQIKKWTPQPIKYVVICSEHGDHTGGNAAFPSTVTLVSKAGPIKLGNTEIQVLNNGRAHTGTDLQVYLPKEKILFASEAFSNHIFPSMRTAWPTEWITTLRNLVKIDATVFIPGHGFIDDAPILKEEMQEFAKALEYVVSEAKRLHKTGVSVEDALKQANWGPYEKWTSKERNAPIAMQRVFDELNGKLK